MSHREQAEVKVQQRHEHEDKEDATAELQEVLGRALVAEGGNSGEHAASLPATLGQQEEQSSAQRQVPARRRGDCWVYFTRPSGKEPRESLFWKVIGQIFNQSSDFLQSVGPVSNSPRLPIGARCRPLLLFS